MLIPCKCKQCCANELKWSLKQVEESYVMGLWWVAFHCNINRISWECSNDNFMDYFSISQIFPKLL